MKIDKIRELDEKEIAAQLKDQGEQAFRLRFQLNMGQTDGVKKLRVLRKDRARMLTVLAERKAKGGADVVAEAPKKAAPKKAAVKKAAASPAKKAAAPKKAAAKTAEAKPKAAGRKK